MISIKNNIGRNRLVTATLLGSKVNQKFAFATADGSKTLSITVRLPVGKTLKVNWGDGSSNEYAGAGTTNVTLSKTYAGAGTYPITFENDYLALTRLECNFNSLSGDASGWSVLINLTVLGFGFNAISGNASTFSSLINLTYLYFAGSSMSGLTINARAIGTCDARNNNFTTDDIDAFLFNTANYFETTAPTKNATYDLSGSPMGIPTGGSSNADLTRLVGYYTAAGFTCNVLIRTS